MVLSSTLFQNKILVRWATYEGQGLSRQCIVRSTRSYWANRVLPPLLRFFPLMFILLIYWFGHGVKFSHYWIPLRFFSLISSRLPFGRNNGVPPCLFPPYLLQICQFLNFFCVRFIPLYEGHAFSSSHPLFSFKATPMACELADSTSRSALA